MLQDLEDEKADLMEQRENWNHQRDHALATGAIGVGEGYHMMSLDTQVCPRVDRFPLPMRCGHDSTWASGCSVAQCLFLLLR